MTKLHKCRSFTRRTLGIACAWLLFTSVSSFAEGSSHRIDNGGWKLIEELSPPWSSVGQINVAGYRRKVQCTGSLIAPNVVVTAAHCVMDPWHHTPFPNKDIHFLAGVRGSSWIGHSTAKCLHFTPDYVFSDQPSAKDVVLITLDDSLDKVPPLELDREGVQSSGVSLVQAAYPAERRYVLTARFGCHLVAQDQNLWLTDCEATPGSSGGPVFIQRRDGLKLGAILVGAGPSRSVAVPVGDWPDIDAVGDLSAKCF